ncbi:hypothetical protein ACNJX9_04015 [Bradyrhizobium sp. DASA03076]|jgi:hypothetical protein|uniref:hypothetical protein n=1 Tax=Bradyrhizobium TaxID=374 RepID=UPI000AAD9E83|nr:hypothetical protein [Bradyrhizobium manausense]
MNRLPMVLNSALWVVLGLIPVLLWQGQHASEILLSCLLASVLSTFISIGRLRWIGLPLNATVDECNERARFLRNQVTRIPTGNDGASG